MHRAPVAQLDRASGFEPEGREFESLRARHHLQPRSSGGPFRLRGIAARASDPATTLSLDGRALQLTDHARPVAGIWKSFSALPCAIFSLSSSESGEEFMKSADSGIS